MILPAPNTFCQPVVSTHPYVHRLKKLFLWSSSIMFLSKELWSRTQREERAQQSDPGLSMSLINLSKPQPSRASTSKLLSTGSLPKGDILRLLILQTAQKLCSYIVCQWASREQALLLRRAYYLRFTCHVKESTQLPCHTWLLSALLGPVHKSLCQHAQQSLQSWHRSHPWRLQHICCGMLSQQGKISWCLWEVVQ